MGNIEYFVLFFKGLTIKHENHNFEVRGKELKGRRRNRSKKGPFKTCLLRRAFLALLLHGGVQAGGKQRVTQNI